MCSEFLVITSCRTRSIRHLNNITRGKMPKAICLFILLCLCGCATAAKNLPQNNTTTITSDRKDIVIVPVTINQHNEKLRLKPPKFTKILNNNSINANSDPLSLQKEGRKAGYAGELCEQFTPDSDHGKWRTKMRNQTKEMAKHINGTKPGSMLDITNIPLELSYKLELDKPRKKAKCNRAE